MESLWEKKATKKDVIRSLGDGYKEVKGGITYPFHGDYGIESAHFFESDILVEQFIFLDEKSLEELRSQATCSWIEKIDSVTLGHTVCTVKIGECLDRQVSYKFLP
jgi:hypothetical protein